MGELKIKLPDNVEIAFRRAAMKRFGYQKGAMSEAAKEAIKEWTYLDEDNGDEEDPVKAIAGLMKNVKKNSVELQHDAWNYVTDKYAKKFKKRNKNDN